MAEKVKRDEIIKLLRRGWELGVSGGVHRSDRPRAWMQKRLGHGGESKDIHMNTFDSMLNKGEIVPLRPREGQHFATVRYGLPSSPEAAKPGEKWTVV